MSVVRRVAIALVSWLTLAVPVSAQSYPDRVVRIVNPFPPGGSVDVLARILAQKLSEHLGQQFIIETRTGGGGNVGAEMVAKSDPDGYTLLFTAPGPLVVNQTLYTRLPFDPARDFAPIALFAIAPIVLMVNPRHPGEQRAGADRLRARRVRARSTSVRPATARRPHLNGELFKTMAHIDIVHVPYRGTGPAMNDLIGGHIQMFFDLLPASLPQIESRKVRALANAGATRPPLLANLPTVAEQGLPGFDSTSWVGIVAPIRTPPAVTAKLIAEVEKASKSPDIVARIQELGSVPGTAFGKDFGKFMEAETAKWAAVIKASGARAD